MASSTGDTGCINDSAVCPICFQKFKKPKMLPCSHTFCHSCLEGLIKSSCSSATSLGFTCPLCRKFIVAPGTVGQWPLDKWASLFPPNQFIEYLIEKGSEVSTIDCDACVEDGEDVRATNWCKDCRRPFCENCSKMHKKFPAVRDHETVSLSEITSVTKPAEIVSMFCTVHEQNKLELFCRDHQAPSCVLCVPMLHRTCDHIGSIQEEVKKFDKTKIHAVGLVKEMKTICDVFEKLIEEEKMNIAKIDEKTDMYIDMVKSACERSVQHLKNLEEKQLNQIAKFSKDGKTKIESTIKDHENRRGYVKTCLKLISETLEQGDDVHLLLQYSFVKEKIREIEKLELTTVKIDLSATTVDEIENIKEFLKLKLDEKSTNIPETIDVARSQLSVIHCFTVAKSNIIGGAFLQDGRILLIDAKSRRCLIYSEHGVLEQETKFLKCPWDVFIDSYLLYVTFPAVKEINAKC
ncbi:E3 ubiquitin-protein ligase TRIM45-like [Saccostrea cucullata]|uniref:E3 ubiquitin-protein ligase TRIM45-like n=1 Tax=Saccostrea cuccullata TaxID=36930 RepID=UPI002ED49E3F